MKLDVVNRCLSPSNEAKTKGVLYRRAKSKYVSDGIASDLIRLKTSPLYEAYERTMLCCGTMLQEGNKLTSKYCNGRWCITCNRMRTAKLMNGYKDSLMQMKGLQFVTLTIRSCPSILLYGTIRLMLKNFRAIKKQLLKKGIKLKGVRKLEITYDMATGMYHPHFHLMIENRLDADYLVLYWHLAFPTATLRKAQDIRAFTGTERGLIELFKYSTKMIASSKRKEVYQGRKSTVTSIQKVPAFALDRIFRALYSLRTFQAMGIPRISEDVDELQSQVYEELPWEDEKIWKWGREYNMADWFDIIDGELLTGYEPSESLTQILNTT